MMSCARTVDPPQKLIAASSGTSENTVSETLIALANPVTGLLTKVLCEI